MTAFRLGNLIWHLAHSNVVLFSTDLPSSSFTWHHTRHQKEKQLDNNPTRYCDPCLEQSGGGVRMMRLKKHSVVYWVSSRPAWATSGHITNKTKRLTSRKSQSRKGNMYIAATSHHSDKCCRQSVSRAKVVFKADVLLLSKASCK